MKLSILVLILLSFFSLVMCQSEGSLCMARCGAIYQRNYYSWLVEMSDKAQKNGTEVTPDDNPMTKLCKCRKECGIDLARLIIKLVKDSFFRFVKKNIRTIRKLPTKCQELLNFNLID
ncbi:hypothetical protein Ddc_15659 [Ditylenchus destructor]|nr:hypothetical protein Ddc_15659 [Ditylenchus destructor]